VRVAIESNQHLSELRPELLQGKQGVHLMNRGRFTVKTLSQANTLSLLLAQVCYHPEKVWAGLSELLINAIEHGNLEISYAEKTQLLELGLWEQEIIKRINSEKYHDRFVQVFFEKTVNRVRFLIEDAGKGFDWNRYLDFSPERAFDMHGRGIAMAHKFSFDAITYYPPGNKVEMWVSL
jgi:hypothetical protein